jgi:uncharacterized protein
MNWNHSINWFEIPALDLNRAFNFYNTVLGGHVRMGNFSNVDLVLFDVPFSTGEAVGGSIMVSANLKPTTDGPVLYINTFDKIDECVSRVETAGGKVIVAKMDLGKFGYGAIIIDSEGNKIGLHQNTK